MGPTGLSGPLEKLCVVPGEKEVDSACARKRVNVHLYVYVYMYVYTCAHIHIHKCQTRTTQAENYALIANFSLGESLSRSIFCRPDLLRAHLISSRLGLGHFAGKLSS